MFGRKARGAVVALTVLLVPASQAQACHWLRGCFGGAPATTAYYAPVVAAPVVAAPCCQPAPQVVNYMPQTAYRTVYVNTPVVSYRPMSACGPCGATTVMRPVTSFVMQPRVVPYTTYRPVVTAGYAPACGGCAAAPVQAAAYYAPAPAPMAAPAPAPAAPCCGANTGQPSLSNYPPTVNNYPPTVNNYAPQTNVTQYSPAPAYGAPPTQGAPTPAYGAPPTQGTPVPFNTSPPSNTTPNSNPTFAPSTDPDPAQNQQPEPQSRTLQPLKFAPPSVDRAAPQSLDPESQDRTTSVPVRQAILVRKVSTAAPVAVPTQDLDASGWRTARQK